MWPTFGLDAMKQMWQQSRSEQYNMLTMVETNDVPFRSPLLGQCILALRVISYWFTAPSLSKGYCCPKGYVMFIAGSNLQSMIGWQGCLSFPPASSWDPFVELFMLQDIAWNQKLLPHYDLIQLLPYSSYFTPSILRWRENSLNKPWSTKTL